METKTSDMALHNIVPPDKFPFCIVWTPLPLITALYPPVGHMGIARSDGVILDFAGPYYVSVDQLAFGRATRYVPLDPRKVYSGQLVAGMDDGGQGGDGGGDSEAAKRWDNHLQASQRVFENRMYSFVSNNCHTFVAHALEGMTYGGEKNYNMVKLGAMVFFTGRFVGPAGAVKTLMPFLLLMSVGIFFLGWRFVVGWAAGGLAFSTLLALANIRSLIAYARGG